MFIVRQKHALTLPEILIVLFLLSLGATLTGVKVREMYMQQRFLAESQKVLNHLAMAQDLMLIMDADVTVHLARERPRDPLHLWLEVDKPLDEKWAKFVERKIALPAIESCEFQGQRGQEVMLRFSLGCMSQGILRCYGAEQHGVAQSVGVALPGYPSPLTAFSSSVEAEPKEQKSPDLYPAEVYQHLYEKKI